MSVVPDKQKTLCIIDSVGRGGGAEQLVSDLVPEMIKQGQDISLLVLYDWDGNHNAKLQQLGVEIHQLNIRSRLAHLGGLVRLRKLIKEHGYNQFWGHLFYGNMFACMAQVMKRDSSSVITLHSEGYAQQGKRSAGMQFEILIHRHLLGRSDTKVAVSRAVSDDHKAVFGWQEMPIIHNGVNVTRLKALAEAIPRNKARAAHGYNEEDFVIVTAARYVPKKGHKYLIDAIALLRDKFNFRAKLYLCSSGPLKDELSAQVRNLGLGSHVTVDGVMRHQDLLPLINAADLFVLPSLREPFGIAAAEAMALGQAPILTRVDGFLELVGSSGTAQFVPPGDSAALAQAIFDAARSIEDRKCIGEKAAAHVATNFDIDVCARQWSALLSTVHRHKARG